MQSVPLTPFRKSYLSILGQILVAMGQVELQIGMLLINMLGRDQSLAANLTFGFHLDRILEIVKAVFYSKPRVEEIATLFEYLMREIKRLSDERNKNIHCAWTFDDAKKRAIRFRIAKHSKGVHHAPDSKEVPLHELESLKDELYNLNEEIQAFTTKCCRRPKTKVTIDQRRATRKLISSMLKKAKARKQSPLTAAT